MESTLLDLPASTRPVRRSLCWRHVPVAGAAERRGHRQPPARAAVDLARCAPALRRPPRAVQQARHGAAPLHQKHRLPGPALRQDGAGARHGDAQPSPTVADRPSPRLSAGSSLAPSASLCRRCSCRRCRRCHRYCHRSFDNRRHA
uniref:Uncharacterized protein n=1 Tax=Emiliania huxleyi (strain CCMP1516) TaxID=280463 RepID=A0A0D3IEY3_EMIH1